jgi:hypothetical protein
MAKLLTMTGLLLGLMMVGTLAFSSPTEPTRAPVECITTVLGDIASCSQSGSPN